MNELKYFFLKSVDYYFNRATPGNPASSLYR